MDINRAHDPLFAKPKIWPTFIYMGQISVPRFQMLPLCALIDDLEKKGAGIN